MRNSGGSSFVEVFSFSFFLKSVYISVVIKFSKDSFAAYAQSLTSLMNGNSTGFGFSVDMQ